MADGMTGWNGLHDWQAAGIWDQIHPILLAHLRQADGIDFERFIVDMGTSAPWVGVKKPAPAPSIARNWGANTPSSPTAKVCPWSPIRSRRTRRMPI